MKPVLWPFLLIFCWPAADGKTNAGIDLDARDIDQLSIISTTFIPTAYLPLDPNGTNRKCIEDSLHYARAFANRSQWAVTMFGASGKLPDNPHRFIRDNAVTYPNILHDVGLFDLCLGSIREADDMPDFRAQYCTVFLSAQPVSPNDEVVDGLLKEPKAAEAARQFDPFKSAVPVNMTIDFCLPSSCTAYDLRMAVAQKVGRTIFERNKDRQRHSLLTITHDRHCHTHEKNNKESAPDWLAYVCFAVIGTIVVLVITATIHEAWQGKPTSGSSPKHVHLLNCFSAMRNFGDLWSTDSSDDEISCVNGIRVLSISGIIVSHVGEEMLRQRLFNKEMMATVIQNPIWKPVANFSYLVDTFFVLGGLLICMSLLRDLDRGRFNLRRFYFHRYIRLTVTYAVVLLLTAGLMGSLGTGPQWYYVKYRSEDCRAYWWTHLLYLNNYIPWHTTYCMFETWYLANDMQMLLLSPLVIYPLWRWRRAGLAWAFKLMAVGLGINIATHILYELPPAPMPTRQSVAGDALASYVRVYYFNTILRYNPYVIGILLGWILHRTKNVKIALNKVTVACGWILSVTALVAILCGLTPYLDEEETPVIDPYFRVLYGSFSRTIWGISIAWIIFACARQHGGRVNTFLSGKGFMPFARLSYSAFLVQYGIVTIFVSYARIPFYFTNDFAITSAGVLLASFVAAIVLVIFVEMPSRNLEKIFLRDNKTASGDAKRIKGQ